MENIKILDNVKGALFDLDGVIVDTAKYHALAWKRLANELGFEFTEKDNEKIKGVSRIEALEILLKIGGLTFSDKLKQAAAQVKNDWYVEYISEIDESELLKGAKDYLTYLHSKGVKVALGSASKNSMAILKNLGIVDLFDAIIDGTKITKSKPDPEVFLLGAKALGLKPSECVVFEDAYAGIQAAKAGGFVAVGIGSKDELPNADAHIKGLYELLA